MTKVAVYGTLLSVHGAQDRLGVRERMVFTGEARIEGVLYDLGGYPGLVPGPGSVYAEVYEVDDEVLEILDDFEDVAAGLYGRAWDRRIGAWVYRYLGETDGVAIIESGDYREGQSGW